MGARVVRDDTPRLRSRLRDMRPLSRRIGAYLLARAREAFVKQGRGVPWPPRMTPNVPGVIHDLERAPRVKERRLQPGPALHDTGRLMGSLAVIEAGPRSVLVGTNVPYAQRQHEGGEVEIPVSATVRVNVDRWLARVRRTEGEVAFRQLDDELGFLRSATKVTIDVAPRPFLEILRSDVEAIGRIVREYVATGRTT